jgi:hypothetical protein
LECFKNPANQAGVSVGLKKTNIPESWWSGQADVAMGV